jgi:hypothetical protein
MRSFHVANVIGKSLRPILTKHINAKSRLVTDESGVYLHTEFSDHGTVNHTAGEYVKADGTHTNTVESSFALLKRGVYGTFHSISETYLHRYLSEFDFRANTREMTDAQRSAALLAAGQGKRLMYRQPD